MKISMSSVANQMTVNLKVTGVKTWTFRWWVASQLLRLAAWTAPVGKFEIEVGE